jgi:hypothetical protein
MDIDPTDGHLWVAGYKSQGSPPSSAREWFYKINRTNGAVITSCWALGFTGVGGNDTLTFASLPGLGGSGDYLLTDLGEISPSLPLIAIDIATCTGGSQVTAITSYDPIPGLTGIDYEGGVLFATDGLAGNLYSLGGPPFNVVAATMATGAGLELEDITVFGCSMAPGDDPDVDGLTNAQEATTGTQPCVNDTDGDGCADGEEFFLSIDRDPLVPWDFFDVPTPVFADPTANGSRNKAISLADAGAALFYVGASNGNPNPNSNGVSYAGGLKDGDWFNAATGMFHPDGVIDSFDNVGRRFDRTPSTTSGKPYRSAPPNGAVALQDVAVLLVQVGSSCVGPP